MNDPVRAYTGQPPRSTKILLVDDNPDHCALIRMVLQQCMPAVQLMVASDLEQAMSQLKANVETREGLPRLILLDLYLPLRDDGWQLLQLLKSPNSRYRLIPVTVLSHSSISTDIQTSYDLGATSYIVKPSDYQKWLAYFQALQQYWWQTVSLPG